MLFMKAIVFTEYGSPDFLQPKDVPKPMPKDDEVLIKVHASSINSWDWEFQSGTSCVNRLLFGLRKPKVAKQILGADVAGTVETVGRNVTRFQPGDEVFGDLWDNWGGFAEYACARESVLEPKPANVSFEEAAAVPQAGVLALQGLRKTGQIQPGQRVLINGAAGGVGSIAVQLAKAYGARVTGVDSTEKMEIVRSLGADHVIDYTHEDFTQRGERYDLIFDVASNLSFSACKRALTPTGVYVLIGHDHFGDAAGRIFGSLPRFFRLMALSKFVSQLPDMSVSIPSKKEVMAVLKEFLEAGKLTPVIDRTYPLSEVPEAMRYLQGGHARGKIIITP